VNCHGREKTSNVQNQITIANDKVLINSIIRSRSAYLPKKSKIIDSQCSTTLTPQGRLTPEEIERMVEDAEKFKAADEAQAAKVAAREEVRNYVYQVQDALENSEAVKKVRIGFICLNYVYHIY
jgi:molecular chaperone DnaK (HSP70)